MVRLELVMVRCDALVIGGGPAGSTCARSLRLAGWNVVVVDRARFPRDKVCAGWLTPGVFSLLELDPADYRASGRTLEAITAFRTSVIGQPSIETSYSRTVSYSARRCEFDEFLLRRSGATVSENTSVTTVRREGGVWKVDDRFEAPVLIGAGGNFCPVAKALRPASSTVTPVVARETEYRWDPSSGSSLRAPALFFCRDLNGYGWVVPKGAYLNVGIGRRESQGFLSHVNAFIEFLERAGLAPGVAKARWCGHAYLASGVGSNPVTGPGVMLVGDAAGLAYPESGEGIKPAVESGRLAADTLIAAGGRYDADDLRPYAEALRARHPPVAPRSAIRDAVTVAVGRMVLRSPGLTRRLVLDRWVLRKGPYFFRSPWSP
jgi:geranylgeranyl reductase family protein